MNKAEIKAAIREAFEEVYEVTKIQGHLSEKQKQFSSIVIKKLFGEEEPKAAPIMPDDTDKPYYLCEICDKKCSSTAGLTLHKKSHA